MFGLVVVILSNIDLSMLIADSCDADETFSATGSSVLTLTPSLSARLMLQRSICAPVSAMQSVVMRGLWPCPLGSCTGGVMPRLYPRTSSFHSN